MDRGGSAKAGIVLLAGLFLLLATTYAHPQIAPTPSCSFGPLTRSFGGSDWLVYGCKDGSLIFIAAPGNPVAPDSMMAFVFEYGMYRVILPRSTDPLAQAAGKAVSALSRDEMRALAAETGAITLSAVPPR